MAQTQSRKIIEFYFLAVVYLSTVSSLARSDYNFAFGLFAYFLWINKTSKSITMMLLAMVAISVIIDTVWIIGVGGLYLQDNINSQEWKDLQGIRWISVIFSCIVVLIKGILIGTLYAYRQTQVDSINMMRQLQQGEQNFN